MADDINKPIIPPGVDPDAFSRTLATMPEPGVFLSRKRAEPVKVAVVAPKLDSLDEGNNITVPFSEYLKLWNVLQLRSIPGIPGDEEALKTMKARIDAKLAR